MHFLSGSKRFHDEKIGNSGRIDIIERVAYGIGDFGCNLIYANIAAFMIFFYTDVVGMSAAVVGTVILISRVFDGFSDVIVGTLVDRTKSRYGKARPWVLLSAVPLGISIVFLFSEPNFSYVGNIVYLFIVYNLTTTICYTSYAIPHGTLVALMTQDQYQRSLLNITRMVLGTIGALFVSTTTIRLVNYFGGGAEAWQYANIVYGILLE